MSIRFSTQHHATQQTQANWQSRRTSSNQGTASGTDQTQAASDSTKLAEDMFSRLDPNGTGSVSKDDFIAQMSAYLQAGRGFRANQQQGGSEGVQGRHHHHHRSESDGSQATGSNQGQNLLDAINQAKNSQGSDNTAGTPFSQGDLLLAALSGRNPFPTAPAAETPTPSSGTDSSGNSNLNSGLGGMPVLNYGNL